jgi:Tfp pilus assembly protein PilN
MLNSARKPLGFAATLVALAALAGTASANEHWQKEHPRRAETNDRLAKQNARIDKDVKNGTMTKSQAQAAHQKDQQVRQEEHDMASQNGGHITKTEQNALNQQENAISHTIPPK